MGYARPGQTARGIHQRLRARAFIIAGHAIGSTRPQAEPALPIVVNEKEFIKEDALPYSYWWDTATAFWTRKNTRLRTTTPRRRNDRMMANDKSNSNGKEYTIDPKSTICFVSIDAGMGSDLLNIRVLKRLNELADQEGYDEFKELCHLENLSISGTHTHAGPAGFLQYALFQITSLGFAEETMRAFTEGVAQALLQAYRQLQPASIHLAQGLLWDANINRSPTSYVLNPPEERVAYAKEGDTDKNMLQLTFTSTDTNETLGLLNWFAVHGTSMNNSNQLLSGDNKGYASYLAERYFNGNGTVTGLGSFVAAFASTNLGDVSPNTRGPRCIDTGLPCDALTSTCGGSSTKCIALGPGKTQLESTEIIGRRQFEHSLKLYQLNNTNSNTNDNSNNNTDGFTKEIVTGTVAFRHSFVDMANLNVTFDDGSGNVTPTCPAALGYSFAGGTTDGPGSFAFRQGTTTAVNNNGSSIENAFWNLIGGYLSIPTQAQIDCQAPKPILLNVGRAVLPYRWDPNTLPISIFRLGQLFILNVPAEFTTMAGRRLRKAVRQTLLESGILDPVVTIAGLANSYSHYVTTFEEYAGQRYEAASTLYGPHTLSAYIQEFRRIATDLVADRPSQSAAPPADLSKKQISLLPPVELDTISILSGKWFGSVAVDVSKDEYHVGETVGVSFHSANPRSNPRLQGTFLTVDVLDNDTGEWLTRYVDGDWCTQYHWKGGAGYMGVSFAEIFWTIPNDENLPRPALYRICHYGARRTLVGALGAGFYRLPAWLTANVFGSYAINFLWQIFRFWDHLSNLIWSKMATTANTDPVVPDPDRLQDFQGCSRTFLVR